MRATGRPSLRETQLAFAAAVFEDAPTALSYLRDGTFSAERHLQVYRNNTFANLTDALAAIYPVVQQLVGEEFFRFCADRFIRHYPPHSSNLHDFGADLASFLAEFPPAGSLMYLPDVARLDWAWHESFHAGEAAPFDLGALSTVAPERYESLIFELHPSVRLLDSPYPLLRIWQVNQPEYNGDQAVDLDQGGDRLLVLRRDMSVEIESLGLGEHALLGMFAEGKTLGLAQQAAAEAEPTFDLSSCLQQRIQSGTIVGVRFA